MLLTNWLLAIALAVLALVVMRASLLEAIDVKAGFIDFPVLASSSVSWFISALILYAFEKHGDSGLSVNIRAVSWITLVAFLLLLVSIVERTLLVDHRAFFLLPAFVYSAITSPWHAFGALVFNYGRVLLTVVTFVLFVGVAVFVLVGLVPVGVVSYSRFRRRREE